MFLCLCVFRNAPLHTLSCTLCAPPERYKFTNLRTNLWEQIFQTPSYVFSICEVWFFWQGLGFFMREHRTHGLGERAAPAKIDPLWTLRRFRRPSAAAAHRLARRIWCTGSTTLRASPVSSAIIHWHHWLHTRLHSHQPDDSSIGGRQLPHRVRSPQRWWNHTTTTIPLSRENTKE
jgi:hypothetical protein